MSDFLFSIGVDAAQADSAVQEFVRRTNAALESIQKVQYASNAGAKQAIENQQRLLTLSQQRLATEEKIAAAQSRNKTSALAGATGGGGGFTDISAVATRNASAIGKQKDALDFLNRIMGNTVFKFVEYELVMKAFNSAVGEVFNSLNEASNVQMEMVLQRLYNSQINVNAALKDSIIIAKEWGSNITDVQQVIGLWTKQTSQMHDATGKLVDSQTALAAAAKLAAESEQFHRASGIDSLEVYTKSISMWHELGLSLGQIPHLYDQIAFAATKIARPLKAQPGTGGKEEGIKDIFDAVAESGATLKAQGMDEATIIATVAQQIENLGQQGTKAGSVISTMFASLNQGGKPLKTWVDALGGPGAFKDADTFMEAAITHVQELKQANADGALHVKPYTLNTWRAFINTLDEVKQRADEIRAHSAGFLQIISEAQMNTYNGQVDRLKASFQELNLALGTQLLPTATKFISFLSGSMLPMLAANSGAVVGLVKAGMMLGAAYLVMLGITKVSSAMMAFRSETESASIIAKDFGVAELGTVAGMEAATAAMNEQKAALALLKDQLAVVEWETGGYQKQLAALGVTEADVAAITERTLPGALATAGRAFGGFAASILRTMAPLLEIYAVMQLVSAGMSAFDDRSNMLHSLDVHLAQKQSLGSRVGYAASNFLNGGDAQTAIAAMFGRDKAGLAQFNNLAKGDPELRKLTEELKASHSDAHKDALRQQILLQAGQDYDQKHFKNIPGYNNLDHIPKWLQDIMNRAKGGTPSGITMPGDLTKPTKPHLATEQQIAAEQTNKDKADAMAEISKWRDTANAAGSYAKTLMDVGKAQGFTDSIVARLTKHLTDQKNAIENGENAAKAEITTLTAQQGHLEALIKKHGGHLDANGNLHGGDKTSAVYAEAKSWRMAEEAITKAKGAIQGYEAQKSKLSFESSQMLGEAKAWAAISDAIPKTVAAVTSKANLSFLGYKGVAGTGTPSQNPLSGENQFNSYIKGLDDNLSHATSTLGKFYTASNEVSTLKELGATIYGLYQSTKDPAELAVFAKMLVAINEAGLKAQKGVQEAKTATEEFDKSIQDLTTKTAASDAQGIGKLLGLSTGDIDAQKTLIDGYGQINDAFEQIDRWVTQEAGSYAGLQEYQKQMVQGAVQYLNIQRELLPLLAQQQTIESSIAYQATQQTLEKAGQAQLDATIDRLMGTQSNSTVREKLYQAAKDGSWMSPSQTLLKDYLTNTIGDWWKQTVQQLTSTMFGDPATKARQLEQQMLQQNRDGLTNIITDEKTNVVQKLITWEQKFAQDVDKFVGGGGAVPGIGTATGSTGGQNPGAGAQGSESNPTVVTTVGDGGQGLFSGTTSQGNLATGVAMGLDSSAMLQKVADNTDTMNNSAKSASDAVTQSLAGQTPSTSGGGILGSLLGPLSQIPGMSSFLNSKTGQALNTIASGAAQGFSIGGMIGGAGSTNQEWGALGGALGSGLGMIGGPAVSAGAGMLGSILGGLFGHSTNPLDEPDVYDTQNYGQFVANINGAPGSFNGVTIAPQPQYSIADGELSMGEQMYQWAQKNPQQPIAKQILALGPKLDIASEYQGEFTLGSGKTISVTAYEQLAQQWQAVAGNQVNAPLISVNSYGGGGSSSAYNTPGMDSSSFLAEEQGWASGLNGNTSGQNAPQYSNGNQGGGSQSDAAMGSAGFLAGPQSTSPTATPGYGSTATATRFGPGMNITSLQLQISTPIYLDGKVITTVVNSYNAQSRSSAGTVGHSPNQ